MVELASPAPRRRIDFLEWRSVAWVVGFALFFALLLFPMTRNTFIEIFGETLFVGMILLAAFNAAGAWKQEVMPVWVAQLIAVVLAAPIGPLIVQMFSAGGDFSRFMSSPPHVRGYLLVSALILGTMVTLGALLRQRHARAQALAALATT